MKKSNAKSLLLVSAALFGSIFFAYSSQAGNLRDAPDLPSIEVNFGAIEKLKAETKQLKKLEKIEAERSAKASALEKKLQIAEEKKAKAAEVAAKKKPKAAQKAKPEPKKVAKKQKRKVTKAKVVRKKIVPAKISHAKVKPEPKVVAHHVEQTKNVVESPKVESPKIAIEQIIEAPKVEVPELPKPMAVVKDEPVNTVAEAAPKKNIEEKKPVVVEPIKIAEPVKIKSAVSDLQKADVAATSKPDVKVAPEKKSETAPVVSENVVSEKTPDAGSSDFVKKISNFFSASEVAEKPAEVAVPKTAEVVVPKVEEHLAPVVQASKAPEHVVESVLEKKVELPVISPSEVNEDEEEIAAREYDKSEDVAEEHVEHIEHAEVAPTEGVEQNKGVVLPKKIESVESTPGQHESKAAADTKKDIQDAKAPPIPPLADLVELKREQPKATPEYKDINDNQWNKVLDDAKKKAAGAVPENNNVAAVTPAQPIESTRPEKITEQPLGDIKETAPKQEKVSIISSVLDWMPSFSGDKAAKASSDNNEAQTASSKIADGEKLPSVKPVDLSVKLAENKVSAQITDSNSQPEVQAKTEISAVTPKVESLAPAKVETKPEAVIHTEPKKEVKQPSLEVVPMPIENVALPTPLNKKSEALNITFKGAEIEIAELDKNRLSDFVKAVISSQSKVKIVSSSPSVGDDVNAARRISLKRAIAIRAQMIEYGLDSGKINVQAIGSESNSSVNGVNILVIENDAQ